MSRLCRVLDVSRSNLYVQLKERNQDMPKKIEKEKDPLLLSFIREITDERPTYGYRRVTALLKKKSQENVNHKRVYRVMRQAGLLLKKPVQKNHPNFDLWGELYRITGVDLTTIPGLDVLAVQTIISDVGVDPHRWPTEKHFASWLGLSPANKITGEKVFSTRTRKVNNRASTAFRMAANSVSRSQNALGAFCRRMKNRLGAPKAITATAHKIACIFYRMLKYGQEYVEMGLDHYEKQYKERLLKNLQKKASELGFELIPTKTNCVVREVS
jgi:hypothetical protein